MLYDDLLDEDIFSGKRKPRDDFYDFEGEPPRREWRGCCCVLVMMLLAAGIGAAAAVYIVARVEEPQQDNQAVDFPTDAPTAAAPATVTPIPAATRTPTPTPRPFSGATSPAATLSPATSPAPARTRRPSTGGAEWFQSFTDTNDFPHVINAIDDTCQTDKTGFTLVLDHGASDDEVALLSVTLEMLGTEASFADIQPQVAPDITFNAEMTITINAATINLRAPFTGETLLREFERAWQAEQPDDITAFSVTWFDTIRQPEIGFTVEGLHPNGGGIFITVDWSRSTDTPQRDHDDTQLPFLACRV